MGFRDDLEAARARAEALEARNAELERDADGLRRRVASLEARLAGRAEEVADPAARGPASTGDVPALVRAASRAVWAQAGLAAAFLLLVWSARGNVVPGSGGPVVSALLGTLGLGFLTATVVALLRAARPIVAATGYGRVVMLHVLWLWIPAVVLVPFLGPVVGIVRAVVLFRGRLEGGVVRRRLEAPVSFPSVRLTRREGWPAGFALLGLAVGLPAMYLSAHATDLGSPVDRLEGETTWAAEVTAVEGVAPVALGARCRVTVEPSWGYNCRFTVDCGGVLLYGGPGLGYTWCEVEAGRPVSAHDPRGTATEGDPMLRLDASRRMLVVADDAPTRYSVTLTLSEPAPEG